jgi:hypothetical protein
MALFYDPAHARLIGPHNHKQIFADIIMNGQLIDEFNMGKPLPVRAYFILAFDNKYPFSFQDTKNFPGCLEIKVQYGLMVFFCIFRNFIILVILFIVLVIDMGASA